MRLLAISILVLVVLAVLVDTINGDDTKVENQKPAQTSSHKRMKSSNGRRTAQGRAILQRLKQCRAACMTKHGTKLTQEDRNKMKECRQKCTPATTTKKPDQDIQA